MFIFFNKIMERYQIFISLTPSEQIVCFILNDVRRSRIEEREFPQRLLLHWKAGINQSGGGGERKVRNSRTTLRN